VTVNTFASHTVAIDAGTFLRRGFWAVLDGTSRGCAHHERRRYQNSEWRNDWQDFRFTRRFGFSFAKLGFFKSLCFFFLKPDLFLVRSFVFP
jgi:hypothetical protein